MQPCFGRDRFAVYAPFEQGGGQPSHIDPMLADQRRHLLQLVIGRSTRQELSPAVFGHVRGCGRIQEILQDY